MNRPGFVSWSMSRAFASNQFSFNCGSLLDAFFVHTSYVSGAHLFLHLPTICARITKTHPARMIELSNMLSSSIYHKRGSITSPAQCIKARTYVPIRAPQRNYWPELAEASTYVCRRASAARYSPRCFCGPFFFYVKYKHARTYTFMYDLVKLPMYTDGS